MTKKAACPSDGLCHRATTGALLSAASLSYVQLLVVSGCVLASVDWWPWSELGYASYAILFPAQVCLFERRPSRYSSFTTCATSHDSSKIKHNTSFL